MLAFIALTIAMAGSAVAASGVLVTSSKQIKAHSIALSDLSKSTVKKLRGKRGLRGLTGATGAQGARARPAPPARATSTRPATPAS